ncbi:MAG: arsenite methyltransferase [Candidatus Aminicenantes bacterium]|nr:arsenite methyltransferase [Candidatus Aminicenantes bacterium]
MKKEDIKKSVRKRYAAAATGGASCCGPSPCACGETGVDREPGSLKAGYTADDLAKIPAESDLGLGCGNPTALAGLKEGETVLDLGAGAGIDCFLASKKVGPPGRVIGVDMTAEMVDRARKNARRSGLTNVEFRLGEIESLPVADRSVDVIISNCVINLSPEKDRVFREAFRVLKPGGRMMVSDLVLKRPLPKALRGSAEVYTACVAGAMLRDEYLREIEAAGFRKVEVVSETSFPAEAILDGSQAAQVSRRLKISPEELGRALDSVLSLSVRAIKEE